MGQKQHSRRSTCYHENEASLSHVVVPDESRNLQQQQHRLSPPPLLLLLVNVANDNCNDNKEVRPNDEYDIHDKNVKTITTTSTDSSKQQHSYCSMCTNSNQQTMNQTMKDTEQRQPNIDIVHYWLQYIESIYNNNNNNNTNNNNNNKNNNNNSTTLTTTTSSVTTPVTSPAIIAIQINDNDDENHDNKRVPYSSTKSTASTTTHSNNNTNTAAAAVQMVWENNIKSYILQYIQYKDQIMNLISILFKSYVFYYYYYCTSNESNKKNKEYISTATSTIKPIVLLPRTKYNKPYIPSSIVSIQSINNHRNNNNDPDDDNTNTNPTVVLSSFSISHQFPYVGIVHTRQEQQQLEQQSINIEYDDQNNVFRTQNTIQVGMDIVIFDMKYNTTLYNNMYEYIHVYQESFTKTEWQNILRAGDSDNDISRNNSIIKDIDPNQDGDDHCSYYRMLYELYIIWSLKEAYTKCIGCGMNLSFHTFEIDIDTTTTTSCYYYTHCNDVTLDCNDTAEMDIHYKASNYNTNNGSFWDWICNIIVDSCTPTIKNVNNDTTNVDETTSYTTTTTSSTTKNNNNHIMICTIGTIIHHHHHNDDNPNSHPSTTTHSNKYNKISSNVSTKEQYYFYFYPLYHYCNNNNDNKTNNIDPSSIKIDGCTTICYGPIRDIGYQHPHENDNVQQQHQEQQETCHVTSAANATTSIIYPKLNVQYTNTKELITFHTITKNK